LLIENSIQIQDSPIAALARDVLALRIEKAFGVKRYTLMRMGAADEIAQTRKREKLIRVGRVCAA
jgi:plasmid maintenance system antidote protein VapI